MAVSQSSPKDSRTSSLRRDTKVNSLNSPIVGSSAKRSRRVLIFDEESGSSGSDKKMERRRSVWCLMMEQRNTSTWSSVSRGAWVFDINISDVQVPMVSDRPFEASFTHHTNTCASYHTSPYNSNSSPSSLTSHQTSPHTLYL